MMKLTLIMIFIIMSGCKTVKPISYEVRIDTLRNRNLQMLDKKDVQLIGVDIPVGGSIVIDKNSITRINENQFLVDREVPVIRKIETHLMAPTRITTKTVDKSHHISNVKDVDKPKTVTKTKTVKKNSFPWWIAVVLTLAVILWKFKKLIT